MAQLRKPYPRAARRARVTVPRTLTPRAEVLPNPYVNTHAVSIRRAKTGDEAALCLLGQATFLEAFAGTIPGDDILRHCFYQHASEKYREWLNESRTAVWLAEVAPGAAPVGYLVLTKPELPIAEIDAADLEVKRVYMLHRFQRIGIGAQLMTEARAYAQARGVRRLLLGVYSGNGAAIAFYENLGYRRVGSRQFQVGSRTFDDFILGLELPRTEA